MWLTKLRCTFLLSKQTGQERGIGSRGGGREGGEGVVEVLILFMKSFYGDPFPYFLFLSLTFFLRKTVAEISSHVAAKRDQKKWDLIPVIVLSFSKSNIMKLNLQGIKYRCITFSALSFIMIANLKWRILFQWIIISKTIFSRYLYTRAYDDIVYINV